MTTDRSLRAERDARADEIFDQALDLDEDDRPGFLAAHCGGDHELRARIERLLVWSAAPPDWLDARPGSSLRDALQDEAAEAPTLVDDGAPGALPPTDSRPRVGPWMLGSEIGRGGMGVVYRAHRADGHFRQEVAIKIMRPGLDSAEARGRFEQERQIIASLRHENIARLYDGGATEDGRPFSAMELVPRLFLLQ